jgi:hypothetical protein
LAPEVANYGETTGKFKEVPSVRMFYIGGMNYETVKEISEAKLKMVSNLKHIVKWTKIDYECEEKTEPMMAHTAIPFNEKIYMFAGSFMYNRKR